SVDVPPDGGGIYNNHAAVILHNTIVETNFHMGLPIFADDLQGSSVDSSSDFNLIGTGGSGGLINGVNGNQVGGADPKLGPLAGNGGPTQTHTLLAGSPAIDKGNNAQVAAGVTTDQRGATFTRTFKTIVDIGAFEVQPAWHNGTKPLDVNNDTHVAANDV